MEDQLINEKSNEVYHLVPVNKDIVEDEDTMELDEDQPLLLVIETSDKDTSEEDMNYEEGPLNKNEKSMVLEIDNDSDRHEEEQDPLANDIGTGSKDKADVLLNENSRHLESSTQMDVVQEKENLVNLVLPEKEPLLNEKCLTPNNTQEKSNMEENEKDLSAEKMEIDESHVDLSSEVNPKVSRELKQLQRSAKESKIINEFTQVMDKTRKSRKNVVYGDNKESHDASQRSSSSETSFRVHESRSEKMKRSMRSQNPDFVIKHQKFLNKVVQGDGEVTNSEDEHVSDKEEEESTVKNTGTKLKSDSMDNESSKKLNDISIKDSRCWQCHREGVLVSCKSCIRSYHTKCLRVNSVSPGNWVCPECLSVLHAETTDNRPHAMKKVNLGHLCELLKFALMRMTAYSGAEPFRHPVDRVEFPQYDDFIVHPMDLTKLETNIEQNKYGSTDGFLADTKWILHNCIIFNTAQSKLTPVAKAIVKICKQEMMEIETCPECYLNANTRDDTWFVEVCSKPHIPLWAKLKGFPYWPAKAMNVSSHGLVDVRFFGQHDKAWVPVKECFLYSSKDPNTNNKGKRIHIAECIKELEVYIKNLKKRFGEFHFAPFRTIYEPSNEKQIYASMLPGYQYVNTSIESLADSNNIEEKHQKADSKLPTSSTPKIKIIMKGSRNNPGILISPITNKDNTPTHIEGYGSDEDSNISKEVEMFGIKEIYKSNIENDENSDSSDLSKKIVPFRGKVRMRGGFTNATGKVRVLTGKQLDCIDFPRSYSNSSSSNSSSNDKKDCSNETEEERKMRKRKISNESVSSSKSSDAVKQKNTDLENANANKESPNNTVTTAGAVVMVNKNNGCLIVCDESSPEKNKENDSNKFVQKDSAVETVSEISFKNMPPKKRTKMNLDCEVTEIETDFSDIETSKEGENKSNKKNSGVQQISGSSDASNSRKISSSVIAKKDQQVGATTFTTRIAEVANSAGSVLSNIGSGMTSSEKPNTSVAASSDGVITVKEEPIDLDLEDDEKTSTSANNEPRLRSTDLTTFGSTKKTTKKNTPVVLPIPISESTAMSNVGSLKSQRARKSFPNKVVNSTFQIVSRKDKFQSVLNKINPQSSNNKLHVVNGNSLVNNNSNNMVYIPNNNGIPSLVSSEINLERPVSNINSNINTNTTSTVNQAQVTFAESISLVPNIGTAPPLTPASQSRQNVVTPPSEPQNHMAQGISQGMASAITEVIVRSKLPKLQARPLGPLRTNIDHTIPPEAGPVTQMLNDNAHKFVDFFRAILEETIYNAGSDGCKEAEIRRLQIENETLKWRHQQEMNELKHNTDVILCELRNTFETENDRLNNETRKQAEMERIRAVKEAKTKQWCANCLQEAQFYCCWNTSYCDYTCQQEHWSKQHMRECAQQRVQETSQVSNGQQNKNKPNSVMSVTSKCPSTGEGSNLSTLNSSKRTNHFTESVLGNSSKTGK